MEQSLNSVSLSYSALAPLMQIQSKLAYGDLSRIQYSPSLYPQSFLCLLCKEL